MRVARARAGGGRAVRTRAVRARASEGERARERATRREMQSGLALGALARALGVCVVARDERALAGGVRDAYDGYASTYDDLDGGTAARALGLEEMRARALGAARGDVLELAVGTGLNLPAYDRSKVRTLTAIDLSPGMLERARARARELELDDVARFAEADATALPFEDGSFDFVVDTFSLCVIEDPVAALREVRRVLRKDGHAVLIEHSKSDVGALGWYQDVTSAPVKAMSKGCVWNQDVESMIQQAGMRVVKSQRALLGLLVVVEAAP